MTDSEFNQLTTQQQYQLLKEEYADYQVDWDYEHNVTICERSKTVVEPLISEEFFLDFYKPSNSTQKTLQQHGLEGMSEVEFFSEDFKDRGVNFLENIKDWCISRDLIWGHRIPVWYNLDTNSGRQFYSYKDFEQDENLKNGIFVGDVLPEDLEKTGNWVREEKILDTWFSSCLWPLSTLDFFSFRQNEQKLFVVHGGDSHKSDQDYINFLSSWNLSGSDYLDIESNWGSWKRDLQKEFKNSRVQVIYPSFPDKLNAKYEAWKIWFEKILSQIGKENLSLVGHSLGGNFLLKYLSENELQVKNLYLVASCIDIGDFQVNTDLEKVEQNCQNICIYHSKDDSVVGFKTALEIQKKLPKAILIEFADRGHFVGPEFLELKDKVKKDLVSESITDFEKFYPTDEMITAKEIFYIWVVRMIVLGKYFTGRIPFKKVVITPTVLDDKGKKMSKSLGNGLDPVGAIEDFSADSLRMAMLSGMIPNRNMKMGGGIAEKLLTKYRNFGNKLWNVARFLESKEEEKEVKTSEFN